MVDSSHHRTRMIGAAFLCAALVLFVQGAVFLVAHAQTATPARIDGQISNGTTNAPAGSIARLPVTLFQMGSSGPVTQSVQTDTRGNFSFTNLALDANSPFFVNVDYEGIHYFSDVFQPGTTVSSPVTITVYETQTLPANYQVDRMHVIVDVAPKAMNVLELLQLQNQTDRAFLLPLPLPLDSTGIQFNDPRDQFRAVRNADGSVSFPVLPTTSTVLLGAQLTTPGSNYTLNIGTPVKLGQLNVLVSQTGSVQVSSTRLSPGTVFTPPQSQQSYWQLNGGPFPASSTVAVAVSNLPGADNSGQVRNAVVLGAGGLAALALLAIPFWRKRQAGATLAAGAEGGNWAEERLVRLQAIADLDDAFEAGELDEQEYRNERDALKAELLNEPMPPNDMGTKEGNDSEAARAESRTGAPGNT